MSFQYLDTLRKKDRKSLSFYIEQVNPKFTGGELEIILDDVFKKKLYKKKGVEFDAFIEIGDYDNEPDFSKLDADQLAQLYKIFISKELKDDLSTKWNFYQYLKYVKNLDYDQVYINRKKDVEEKIDFIIANEETEDFIVAVCVYVLDLDHYNQIIENIKEFAKKHSIQPTKVIIVASKTYRNIPIDKSVDIYNLSLKPELWVEDIEIKKQFNGEDLLIVVAGDHDNENLELAGFNFSSTQDLLDYVYTNTDGGQISIFKQNSHFSEIIQEKQEVELIWRGIMVKNNI